MINTRWSIAFSVALVSMNANAQLYEDRLDPDELDIRDITELARPASRYIGNQACAKCHASAQDIWLGTKHARAFVPLRSVAAVEMGEDVGITTDEPAKSGKCLRCHATGHNVPATHREVGFRMGEGVTCEACHGPGGAHVSAAALALTARAGAIDWPGVLIATAAAMRAHLSVTTPERELCITCHEPKRSHESAELFDIEAAWVNIAHSERGNEEEME